MTFAEEIFEEYGRTVSQPIIVVLATGVRLAGTIIGGGKEHLKMQVGDYILCLNPAQVVYVQLQPETEGGISSELIEKHPDAKWTLRLQGIKIGEEI